MEDNSLLSLENITMPFSLEAEQAVLGSVLVDPSCLSQAAVYISPESFYLPQHNAIFAAMLMLDGMGTKIDPLVVLDQLVQQGYTTAPRARIISLSWLRWCPPRRM